MCLSPGIPYWCDNTGQGSTRPDAAPGSEEANDDTQPLNESLCCVRQSQESPAAVHRLGN